MKPIRHMFTALLILASFLSASARPAPPHKAEEPPSPARVFIDLVNQKDSTRAQRRKAWNELLETGDPIPKGIIRAIDRKRGEAWKRLISLVRDPEVKKSAVALHGRIHKDQQAVKEIVRGDDFSKSKLDAAMAPINKEVDAAMHALKNLPDYDSAIDNIDEIENYSVDAGTRLGWNNELRDTWVLFMLVSQNVMTSPGSSLMAHNMRAGKWIDPFEESCITKLNAHRLLLGLHAVMIDLRLVVAARKHSEEMKRLKYFSHTSPTKHLSSPGKRAAREYTGWNGECIAGGRNKSGVSKFKMWYYSQGHHRIMINGASCVGVGRAGGLFTLMMGNSKPIGSRAKRMEAYVRERYRCGNDPDKLVELAHNCIKQRLIPQAEDELARALRISPKHEKGLKLKEYLDRLK